MINNELVALLKMAVAEETCGLQNTTPANDVQVQSTGLQSAIVPQDAPANNNSNTPNWWWLVAAAAVGYLLNSKNGK